MELNPEEYENVIVYGIGQYYEQIKKDLFQQVKPDYLCDRKWDDCEPGSYDGIPVIKRKDLQQMEHSLIILTAGVQWTMNSVKSDLESIKGISVIHVDEVIGRRKFLTGKELKEICGSGCYRDKDENCVYFDETIPDSILIHFQGKQNSLTIGRNIIVEKLAVVFGNKGVCRIGAGTDVIDAYFTVSGACLSIGEDCLLASGIMIRSHDGHHIFDLNTHKRINYPKDVVIGDHVWIGQNASILAGAKIGKGSVVGACTVTSGQFGEHQIIAGCPARVIREHICWSKDATDYFNHDILEECISQEALKYL